MPLIIHCPNCSKRYQVAESSLGKGVRCQQCEATFTIESAVPPANDPLAGLTSDDLQHFPAASTSPSLGNNIHPLQPSAANSLRAQSGRSNPSGGPTDAKLRLGACGMIAIGVALIGGSLIVEALTGRIFLMVIGLAPLMFILGVVALISPNSIRSIGQYGGHLPAYYKFIGWGSMGLSFLLTLGIFIVLVSLGYESDVPRAPRARPGQPRRPSMANSTTPPLSAPSGPQDGTANPNSTKTLPQKAYPVTIAVPTDSQLVPTTASLAKGTRLQACWSGKWNPITLLATNEDGTLSVRWDDFGEIFDCRMIREELIVKKDTLAKAAASAPN